eukprot:TRINITY_DN14068_c0_g3_i1.p1 TRINITY_DN14068_c0_g3~~TRINITY_DN14068_c0_g3_i1.p1  ORF type:complete len:437 (+),score=69.26 TRINITY_DN14068_c0_g3_i1:158-1468(+)
MSRHSIANSDKTNALKMNSVNENSTTCDNSFRPCDANAWLYRKTLPVNPQPVDKATIHELVQAMLKERREQRALYSRNANLKSTLVSSFGSCPVQSDFLVGDAKRTPSVYKGSVDGLSSHRCNASKEEDVHGSGQIFKKSLMSLRVENVFDKLYMESKCKTIDPPLSTSTHAASSRFRKSHRRSETKVEDRLLEYRKNSLAKLRKRQAQLHAEELSLLQSSPRILNTGMGQVSPYGSLLERFEALERERQRKRVQRSSQFIKQELSHIRESPHINKKSRELARNVEQLLSWESARKAKLEIRKEQKRKAEMAEIIENSSQSHIAPGSYFYLKRAIRKSIEDLRMSGKKPPLKLKNYPFISKKDKDNVELPKNDTRNKRFYNLPLAVNTQATENYIASTRVIEGRKEQLHGLAKSYGGSKNLGKLTNRRANSIVVNM